MTRRSLLLTSATAMMVAGVPASADAYDSGWALLGGQRQGMVYLRQPVQRRGYRPPMAIYHHGATATASFVVSNPPERRLLDALVRAGYLVLVSDFGGDQWGNASDHKHIDNLIALGRAHGGRSGPVALLGTSMGGGSILSYAGTHPARVACVTGFVPVIDLADLAESYPTAVNPAFPPAYSDTRHGLRRSPLVMSRTPRTGEKGTSMFSGVPLSIWYGLADGVCKPEAVEQFARNIERRRDPRVRLHALAGMEHGYGALDMAGVRPVVRFVRDHLPA